MCAKEVGPGIRAGKISKKNLLANTETDLRKKIITHNVKNTLRISAQGCNIFGRIFYQYSPFMQA